MEYAEFGVAPFAVQVKRSVVATVEIDSPFEQLADLLRSFGDDFPDGDGVAQPVAGHHGVVDMLVEVVDAQVGDRRHSSLGEGGVSLVERAFTYQSHAARPGYFEGETHAGDTSADHQIVVFSNHCNA